MFKKESRTQNELDRIHNCGVDSMGERKKSTTNNYAVCGSAHTILMLTVVVVVVVVINVVVNIEISNRLTVCQNGFQRILLFLSSFLFLKCFYLFMLTFTQMLHIKCYCFQIWLLLIGILLFVFFLIAWRQ